MPVFGAVTPRERARAPSPGATSGAPQKRLILPMEGRKGGRRHNSRKSLQGLKLDALDATGSSDVQAREVRGRAADRGRGFDGPATQSSAPSGPSVSDAGFGAGVATTTMPVPRTRHGPSRERYGYADDDDQNLRVALDAGKANGKGKSEKGTGNQGGGQSQRSGNGRTRSPKTCNQCNR